MTKPRILASKCLGFAACRWDGSSRPDKFIDKLKGRIDFVTVCPEIEIGLGVPRSTIEIVVKKDRPRLVQPDTNRDLTRAMKAFTKRYLDSLGEIDGCIMKANSPSCDLARGFFGTEVAKRFPRIPIETETNLKDSKRRKKFLKKVVGTVPRMLLYM